MAAHIRIDRTLSERDVARIWVAVLEGVTKSLVINASTHTVSVTRLTRLVRGEYVGFLSNLWRD